MQLFRSGIIGFSGINKAFKSSQIYADVLVIDPRSPFLRIMVKTHAFVTAGVVLLPSSIPHALRTGAFAEVLASIVQGIVVAMVHLLGKIGTAQHESVHAGPKVIIGVEGLRSATPLCMPSYGTYAFEVCSVHNGNLPFCECDISNRLVRWLNNHWPFHTNSHAWTATKSLNPARLFAPMRMKHAIAR